MKYELAKEQVNNLLKIIEVANIKGVDAPVIVGLINSLNTPIKEEKKK